MNIITVNGIEYTVNIPVDINELHGPLNELRQASGAFTHAQTLLAISESALRVLAATGKVLGILVPTLPARVIQGATLGELEGVVCTAMGYLVQEHGAAAESLWQGRPSAETN